SCGYRTKTADRFSRLSCRRSSIVAVRSALLVSIVFLVFPLISSLLFIFFAFFVLAIVFVILIAIVGIVAVFVFAITIVPLGVVVRVLALDRDVRPDESVVRGGTDGVEQSPLGRRRARPDDRRPATTEIG